MSGITVGTRLDQLYALRDRIAQEIRVEERALALSRPPFKTARKKPGSAPEGKGPALLAALGVTSRQVRDWAIREGLMKSTSRGRVSGKVIQEYADAVARQALKS